MIIPLKTAKALLKFASADKQRPNFYGVGVTKQGIAATDGFAAVEFHVEHNLTPGLLIERKFFETSTKLAAVTKSPLAVGRETKFVEDQVFPDIATITPSAAPSSYADRSIKINPQYLALLYLVADACETPEISLSTLSHGHPIRFDVVGKHTAIVLINHR